MIKILFNGHDFKFLNYLIEHCEKSAEYQVVMDFIPDHEMSHIDQSRPLLEQADLVFCEWALGNAEWYSVNKVPGQKLVIRLHHQEINLPFLNKICWSNVDQIVFICPENMEIFLRRFPFMTDRTSLIYNLIDCCELDRPKLPGARFNLGFIGTAPMRKAPHLALDIFERLKTADDRYMLYVKGKHPWEYPWLWNRKEERAYYEAIYNRINRSEFSNSVVFDPHGNDIPDWFSKIGFILSTSEHEGSHQAVAEGMAAGSIPVIRNWAGAEKLYPSRFVVRTVDEAVDLVKRYSGSGYDSQTTGFIRQFARENFDNPVIIGKYEALFRRLTASDAVNAGANRVSADPSPAAPLKVIHVCYLNAGSQSGYEVRVIEETKALVRQGILVYIVVYLAQKWFQDVAALETYRQKLEAMTRATIVFFPTDHFFDLDVNPAMLREIDEPLMELARLHDIRILHGQALYSTMHALRVARVTGARVVFDVHGISPEETAMTGGTSDRVDKMVEFERDALNDADLKVMVSNRMNSFFREKYEFQDLPYALVPCCVRSNEFQISAEERTRLRVQKGLEDKFVILYLGTLSIWQWPGAMFNLFSAFHQAHPDSILYLMIPGYDHAKALEYIEQYALPAGSYLLEEVAHHDVGKIIGIADAGLLLRESHPVNLVSSPTKFGEYLAAGVPVILTGGIGDYSAMSEDLNVGITLSLDAGNFPSGEQERLLQFARDIRGNRDEWRMRCVRAAQEQLDWTSYIKQLVGHYRTLVGE